MKKIWKVFERFAGILPFLFVFISSLAIPTDPDLGWHLKYGEYFFQHGKILRENTFSTLMPDFKWANGQWGADVLTYAIYHTYGFLGLILADALIVTLTFYFFAKAARLDIIDRTLLFPLLIFLEFPMNSVSFRGQQISLLFTGILVFIISRYKPFSKLFFLLPVLFLIWANIHEQFFLAFAILVLWMGIYIIKNYFTFKKYRRLVFKEAVFLFFISLIASLTTLINPFGMGIHVDALLHFNNPLLKDITEYLPFTLFSQLWWTHIAIGLMVFICIIFLIFDGRFIYYLPYIGAALVIFVLSFEVRRYAWPAYYLIVSILQPLAEFLEPGNQRRRLIFSFIISVICITIVILHNWPFNNFTDMNWDKYCISQNTMCSPASAKFLKKSNFKGKLLSLYGWGGWLIWNFPDIKPSIDGRMHLWVDDRGYSGFAEYYNLEQNTNDVDKSKYTVVYMSNDKPIYKRLEKLVAKGKWQKVYEDKIAGIFVKKLEK